MPIVTRVGRDAHPARLRKRLFEPFSAAYEPFSKTRRGRNLEEEKSWLRKDGNTRQMAYGISCIQGTGDATAPANPWNIRVIPGMALELRPRRRYPGIEWWARLDSNQRPDRYERPALTN